MKTILLLALGALSIASAAPEQQPSPPVQAERMTAAGFAEGMRALLPQPIEDGILLTAARAEGDVLVFTVTFSQALPEAGRDEFVRGFTAGMCQGGKNPFFENGVAVRVETVAAGAAPQRAEVLRACPAPAR